MTNQHDTYERNTIEQLLDAGSSFDWITPAYAIVRNAFNDGTSVVIHSDIWHVAKQRLAALNVSWWAETLSWDGATYWICISLAADDVPVLNSILTSYGHAEVQDQGRTWQWIALGLMTVVVLATLGMVAIVGGAL